MSEAVEVVVLDQFGDRRTIIEDALRIEYARGVGMVGGFKLLLPLNAYDPALFAVDSRVEFWRSLPNGRKVLDTDAPFFIRGRRRARFEDGSATLEIRGPSAVELLNRRIVAYPANDGKAKANGPVDDVMKDIVLDNFRGGATDADRRIPFNYLDIQPDESLGPTVAVRFSRRNVLDLFGELSAGSMLAGTPVFFDVVRHNRSALSFRTYIGQRGANRGPSSAAPLVFSAANGNLAADALDEGYEDEVNAAYAGGAGQETDRLVGSYVDSTRAGRSVWGRREAWVDARDSSDTSALTLEATAAVVEGRPRVTVTGSLVSTEGSRYGVDWGFGDRVVAESFGHTAEVWANALAVVIDESGEESIVAKVEGVDVSA